METLKDFEFKQRKYMPVFPKASGKPTISIEGYPGEDDEPMAATGYHAEQISNFFDQLYRYFAINPHIYVGVDNFIYYRKGDLTKVVAPDVYVVLGVDKFPQRRSFYTWSEGAVPTAVFEFLSDSTANQDRNEKVQLYLMDMGVPEYFIHQPEMEKPPEFRGWRRSSSGDISEILPDTQGGLFSETLNLLFRWEDILPNEVRLLRPYLPDGTLITTSMEEEHLRIEEQHRRMEEQHRRMEEERLRMEEQRLRIEEERLRMEEQRLRIEAEARAEEETRRRQALEAELERLRGG